jgi:hypothetical protein
MTGVRATSPFSTTVTDVYTYSAENVEEGVTEF